jgi:hypothetical protein
MYNERAEMYMSASFTTDGEPTSLRPYTHAGDRRAAAGARKTRHRLAVHPACSVGDEEETTGSFIQHHFQ